VLDRFFGFIIRNRVVVIIIFIFMTAVCGFLMLGVGNNYDLSKYLPVGTESKDGIDILKDEYSYNGNALLYLKNKSIVEVQDIKQRVSGIDGVENVVWLDDVADLKQPVELIDEEVRNNYIVGNDALLQIVFTEDDYSEGTHNAINGIKSELGKDALLSGSAMDAYGMVNATSGSILTGILIALAICILILLITNESVMEVVLFLFNIGVAILLNMGTNIVFGEISFMTFSSAAILQLAVSMDYSIFLLHRFNNERKTESDPAKAMLSAIKATFASILSSGMTTLVGFLALVFMSYTIGADMGLVLAKGIIFSLISVLILLPALAVLFVKAIDRTRHRRLLPSLKKVQHILGGKARYIVIALLAVACVITYMAQSNNEFLYSTSGSGDEKQLAIDQQVEDTFGYRNNFVALAPRGDAGNEYAMASELKAEKSVKSVQGIYAFIDPSVPIEIVPDYLKDEFLSENYSRYIVEVSGGIESEVSLQAVEQIRNIVKSYYSNAYVTGASPVIYDVRDVTSDDFSLVTILSIVFVGIIILVTFRSISIPFLLLFVIETSIWINMSIPYFSGMPMIFIGYMVISSVQLGATIDYAILMTSYYREGRQTMGKREAAEFAVDKAGASIMVSALVLSAAGFVVSAVFVQPAMAQLGTLIGQGALLSGFLSIFVLPQLLMMLDRVIDKTTIKGKLIKRGRKNEI
jgi:predicted RND superfamily exporter protein